MYNTNVVYHFWVKSDYDYYNNITVKNINKLDDIIAKYNAPTQTYYWYYKDHLGTTRQVGPACGTLYSATQKTNHYPFGQDYTSSGDETDYTFTGKEKDNTGLLYFGARYYDPSIGRFLTVDPKALKYPALTPYHYCANNPLIFVDLDGADFTVTDEAMKIKSVSSGFSMLMKTDLGSKLVNKIDDNRKIYVSLAVGERYEGNYGSTRWFGDALSKSMQKQGLIPRPHQSSYKAVDIKIGQKVCRVMVNTKNLDKLTPKQIAKIIYHELKAHVDLNPNQDNSKKGEEKSHSDYGETYFDEKDVDPNSEAGEFFQQLDEVEKEEEKENKNQ